MVTQNSTQAKIKDVAKKIFIQKGYDGTRTRDITEAAGINTALLNYHFGSKENLFALIMLDTMSTFIQKMGTVFNDSESSFHEKVNQLCSNYIDFLLEEPELPTFILSESRKNPGQVMEKVPLKELVMDSSFVHQYAEGVQRGEFNEMDATHVVANLISMITFPFAASNLLKGMGGLNDTQFNDLMTERKTMIPNWFMETIKTKQA